jgi:DNA-binding transcriptional ArsR family regulator
VKAEDIYTCLSDPIRLRIVNLLAEGPLCGCMIEEIVDVSQVKVSKQLAYLKKLGAVSARREANWVVYALAEPVPPVLAENMRLLRNDKAWKTRLSADLEKQKALRARLAKGEKSAPLPVKKHCCCFGRRMKDGSAE